MLEEIEPEVGKWKVAQQFPMGGSDAGETPEVKVMDEEQVQQMFSNMQQMLGEIYEDKKATDEDSSSKATKKEKGNGKVDKPPSPPSSS